MPPKRPRKPTRRARGSGSIFFNEARGRWVGRVPVGKKPNGDTLYTECWGATQAEVVRRMADAKPPGPDVTVAGWAARWLASLTNRPQTRANYQARLDDHALPRLGHLRLVAVTAADMEHLAADLLREPEPLEVSTTLGVLGTLRTMFGAAVRAGLIPKNPVTVARKPKLAKKKVEPYTPDELRHLIDAADWYSAGRVVALMAGTGCRIGEAIALDAADFDRKAGTVAITKTLVPRFGIGPPKSSNSVRTIRVPAQLLPVLQAAAGDRATGPLFRTSNGRRFPAQNVDGCLRRTLRRMGLPPRGSHNLRHSVASHLVAAGVPVADVAKYLGDDVATIVRVYLHPTGADPAAALERLYGGRKVGKGKSA